MDLLVCVTCGTQYDTTDKRTLENRCRICEDPRQFVPESGQAWTSLGEMRRLGRWTNIVREIIPRRVFSLTTAPKFGIGQRCIFVKGEIEEGNVLWDCLPFLDEDTVNWIELQGGLTAIAISHPHMYATAVSWAEQFRCRIHVFGHDRDWVMRPSTNHEFVDGEMQTITADLQMYRIGGHFEGSAVLLSRRHKALLSGDTLLCTPGNRRVTMMWSVPNMIPLSPDWIAEQGWPRLNALDFDKVLALMDGMQIMSGAKEVVRDSLQTYIEKSGSALELEHIRQVGS